MPTLPAFGVVPPQPVIATATQPPASTATLAPTETPTALPSFTPIPTLTPTRNTTAAVSPAAGATTTAVASTVSASATVAVDEPISIDKLPKDTVYKRVRIENATRSQMDISLHCTTPQGLHTILEYEGVKHLTVEAPDGDYVYVVYVGGRQIVGSFSLRHVPGVLLTVYSDHVTVR